VFGCGMMVRSGTVGMVKSIGVPSGGGVVVMGTVGITMLHPHEMGKLELPPLLKAKSSSPMDSS
jgi:hypothetical protein